VTWSRYPQVEPLPTGDLILADNLNIDLINDTGKKVKKPPPQISL